MDYVPDTPWGDQAMSFDHLATMTGLSVSYLRCDYQNIGIPHERLAGRVIFLRGSVQQWLDKRAAEAVTTGAGK